MTPPEKALTARIRELRRRHFGARGKAAFAARLGIPIDEYEPYEKSTLPPGELMVRMCEQTGEDLQWLLTGAPASGTVVISGARHRHRHLLTRIAQTLDAEPKFAAPLEAFLELLVRGDADASPPPALLPGASDELIPLYTLANVPARLPDPADDESPRALVRRIPGRALTRVPPTDGFLTEPAPEYDTASPRRVQWVDLDADAGALCACIRAAEIARCFPNAFGVRWPDDSMQPMFEPGDGLLVAPGVEPRLGAPAFCKFTENEPDRCRIWLGGDDEVVHLGRVHDGGAEDVPRSALAWALEVVYRVARAA